MAEQPRRNAYSFSPGPLCLRTNVRNYLTFNAHSCAAGSMLCGCRCCFESGIEIQLKAEHLYSPDLNVTVFPAALIYLTEKYVCTAQHGRVHLLLNCTAPKTAGAFWL